MKTYKFPKKTMSMIERYIRKLNSTRLSFRQLFHDAGKFVLTSGASLLIIDGEPNNRESFGIPYDNIVDMHKNTTGNKTIPISKGGYIVDGECARPKTS